MIDVTLFPDVTAEAMAFINENIIDVLVVMTADEDWDWQSTLVTVSDTGGRGEWSTVWGAVYSDAQITINVSDPDAVKASEVARSIHAMFMVWDVIHPKVSKVESVTKPIYYPNPQPLTPNYQMTFLVRVEGEQTTI